MNFIFFLFYYFSITLEYDINCKISRNSEPNHDVQTNQEIKIDGFLVYRSHSDGIQIFEFDGINSMKSTTIEINSHCEEKFLNHLSYLSKNVVSFAVLSADKWENCLRPETIKKLVSFGAPSSLEKFRKSAFGNNHALLMMKCANSSINFKISSDSDFIGNQELIVSECNINFDASVLSKNFGQKKIEELISEMETKNNGLYKDKKRFSFIEKTRFSNRTKGGYLVKQSFYDPLNTVEKKSLFKIKSDQFFKNNYFSPFSSQEEAPIQVFQPQATFFFNKNPKIETKQEKKVEKKEDRKEKPKDSNKKPSNSSTNKPPQTSEPLPYKFQVISFGSFRPHSDVSSISVEGETVLTSKQCGVSVVVSDPCIKRIEKHFDSNVIKQLGEYMREIEDLNSKKLRRLSLDCQQTFRSSNISKYLLKGVLVSCPPKCIYDYSEIEKARKQFESKKRFREGQKICACALASKMIDLDGGTLFTRVLLPRGFEEVSKPEIQFGSKFFSLSIFKLTNFTIPNSLTGFPDLKLEGEFKLKL